MFYLLLGISAWTDLKQGVVYDWCSLLLFGWTLITGISHLLSPWFWGTAVCLLLLIWHDQAERCMGRGDYLILLSVSLHCREALPLVLLSGSLLALLAALQFKVREVPFVPFLFLGSLVPLIGS
ncbi:MAG: hypothetical protein QMB61_09820 [Clostridiaceae bacterium]